MAKASKGIQAKAREKERNQNAFLAALADTGNISRSAIAAGIKRGLHYKWLEEDEEGTYLARVNEALDTAADELEAEARRRAIEGLRRYKFDRAGQPLQHPETNEPYYELEYSDPLLIFLLKGAKPSTYRERHEVTGAGGGPVQVETVDLSKLSTETLLKIREELRA